MKIITLLNEKGGVGKTTLAVHIAAGLAIRGHKVVLVDSDPQGHATVSVGIEKEPRLYDLLVRGAPFKEVLRLVPMDFYAMPGFQPKGQLAIIPSNVETRSIPIQISDPFVIQDRFRELEGLMDYVVFDTSPTPSLLHGAIYLATDALIYPTKCERLSFDGLLESFNRRADIQATRSKWGLSSLDVMGIVPTMYRAGTVIHQENLNILKTEFGNLVWPEMPMRTVWAEASMVGQTVFAVAPDSSAARDAWSVVDRVEMGVGA